MTPDRLVEGSIYRVEKLFTAQFSDYFRGRWKEDKLHPGTRLTYLGPYIAEPYHGGPTTYQFSLVNNDIVELEKHELDNLEEVYICATVNSTEPQSTWIVRSMNEIRRILK